MNRLVLRLLIPLLLALWGRSVWADEVAVVQAQGTTLNLAEHLATNRVTVLAFTADWCPACRAVEPHLRAMATEDEQVKLLLVDVVALDSPVSRQFALSGVPTLKVYQPTGVQVGEDTASIGLIRMYVKKAKRGLTEESR